MKNNKFSRTVALLGQAINTKSPIPIFQCVYLRTVASALIMVARGATATIVRREKLYADLDLNVAVPYDTLTRVLGAMGDGDLELTQKGSTLLLRCDGTDAKIAGMVDDGRLMDVAVPKDGWIEFDQAAALTSALSRVKHARADSRIGRGVFGGIGLALEGGRLEATAFDGFQFAAVVVDGPIDEEYAPQFSAAVSGDAVIPVVKIGNEMGECRLRIGEGKLTLQSVSAESEDWWLIEAALLEGTHPGRGPMQKVIDARLQTMVLRKSDMLRAIDLILAVRSDRVLVEATTGAVLFNSPELEVGSISHLIEADKLPVDDATFALDPDFLLSALHGIDGEWVALSTSRNGPIHVCARDGGDFDALVMLKTISGPATRERAAA